MSHWTDGIFIKANALYEKGMHEKAFDWFLKGANAGNSSCMVWLGVLYGEGVKEDARNQKELTWYKRAWKRGDLIAPNNIAIVYKNQKRYLQAERWFKTAIQSGNGDANLELAKMLITIRRDNNEICKYLRATIESSHVSEYSVEEAQRLLDICA